MEIQVVFRVGLRYDSIVDVIRYSRTITNKSILNICQKFNYKKTVSAEFEAINTKFSVVVLNFKVNYIAGMIYYMVKGLVVWGAISSLSKAEFSAGRKLNVRSLLVAEDNICVSIIIVYIPLKINTQGCPATFYALGMVANVTGASVYIDYLVIDVNNALIIVY